MTIPSAKYLKIKARTRIETGKEPQKVVLVYACISAVIAFVVTALRYVIAEQISKTGGLQNIGARSVLSTVDNVLPILQMVVMMCLGLGYVAAMLRISRRQYASPKTLKAGFERFGTLLRSRLLMGLVYAGLGIFTSYVATTIFTISPLSSQFKEIVTPMISMPNFTPEALLADDAIVGSLFSTLIPVIYIYMAIYLPLLWAVSYRFRMVDYLIIDHPDFGAMKAIRQSRTLMYKNSINLFKVDLSFWWYYVIQAVCVIILYLDIVLAIFGVTLPFPGTVIYFGTVLLYLAADFCINYFFRNKIEVTYALAYTSIAPKEKEDSVVLGNIFQM